MRRVYIALGLIIISLTAAYFTGADVKSRSEKHLYNIKTIEIFLKNKDYKKAEKLCKKAADDFKINDSRVMYTYYNHNDLSDIGENLGSMLGYIERKKETEYYYISGITKNKLQGLIDREPIRIRNIL